MRTLTLVIVVALFAGCSNKDDSGSGGPDGSPGNGSKVDTSKTQPKSEPKPMKQPKPESTPKTPRAEPDVVKVQHVLVGFKTAAQAARMKGSKAETRNRAEAEAMVKDILARAQAGEDFAALMKAYSDDPGLGTYGMVNRGKAQRPGYYPRTNMAPSFGDVGFSLEVGEIGLAEYDPTKAGFGWHIIKRVE